MSALRTHDLVIRGALVYRGDDGPPRVQDVAVDGDSITALADAVGPGDREIDAGGLALCPGFIDVHSHDDLTVLVDPTLPAKVLQGVTTDVVGNCGFGAAPRRAATEMFRPAFGSPSLPTWRGYAGYMSAIEDAHPSLNVAVLAGHGTMRLDAGGGREGALSPEELEQMRTLLREGLEAGVLGMSSGLVYHPGRHADAIELTALARDLERHGALYATHMRNEGARLVESVEEALGVARDSGVSLQISHHKAAGRDNWGRVERSLRLLDEAREQGLAVHSDVYPYTAGSTILEAIVSNMDEAAEVDWDRTWIASMPGREASEGASIGDLARRRGVPPLMAARDLLAESDAVTVVVELMAEDDVRTVMTHPATMIGSDGIDSGSRPHPRMFGCFPRVLGTYVRELGTLSMGTAIHKMTGLPAAKFGLTGRGVIAEGACADMVVFDPATVRDVATYAEPRHGPTGIAHVFVNGTEVARGGTHTGARPGRVLRRAR